MLSLECGILYKHWQKSSLETAHPKWVDVTKEQHSRRQSELRLCLSLVSDLWFPGLALSKPFSHFWNQEWPEISSSVFITNRPRAEKRRSESSRWWEHFSTVKMVRISVLLNLKQTQAYPEKGYFHSTRSLRTVVQVSWLSYLWL